MNCQNNDRPVYVLRILSDPAEVGHDKRQLFSTFLFFVGYRHETDLEPEGQMLVGQRDTQLGGVDGTQNCTRQRLACALIQIVDKTGEARTMSEVTDIILV